MQCMASAAITVSCVVHCPSSASRSAGTGTGEASPGLSQFLGSSLWPKQDQVTVNQLWDMIPEERHSPIHDAGKDRRVPLGIDHQFIDRTAQYIMADMPVFYFPPHRAGEADEDAALKEYLAAFPDLPPLHSYQWRGPEPGFGPNFVAHADGWMELSTDWSVPGATGAITEAEQHALTEAMSRPYNGTRLLFPAAGTSRRSMYPLRAWWAVLLTLLMLARYQPAEWAAHIDIDTSPMPPRSNRC